MLITQQYLEVGAKKKTVSFKRESFGCGDKNLLGKEEEEENIQFVSETINQTIF